MFYKIKKTIDECIDDTAGYLHFMQHSDATVRRSNEYLKNAPRRFNTKKKIKLLFFPFFINKVGFMMSSDASHLVHAYASDQ